MKQIKYLLIILLHIYCVEFSHSFKWIPVYVQLKMTISKFTFEESLKNVPIPTKDGYLRELLSKTEDFIQRVRWKSFFYLKGDDNAPIKETFGFKTPHNAPQIQELIPFEHDLTSMIANLEFSQHKN